MEDEGDELSGSLGRMSLLSPENHLPPQTLKHSTSTSSLKAPKSPGTPRRISGGDAVTRNADWPSQNRRSPPKPFFGRQSSLPHSPKLMQQVSMSAPVPEEDPIPPVTSASIASDYFRKELALHTDTTTPETVVIIHDACYGHRYSRPKTSKTNLSLIVERPERIQAGITGIAAAYVRLGRRHAGSDNAPHPQKEPSSKVPFGVKRSSRSTPLTASVVTAVHGTKWMQDLTIMCKSASDKLAAGTKELTRPDTPGSGLPKPKLHEGDLYLCRESLVALQGALGGVLDGVDAVFRNEHAGKNVTDASSSSETKRAFVCVRPPGHHCSADLPSGFCWLNNVHVGIEHAAQMHGLTHAAIIDFDLHHGDGSQNITWDRNFKAARAPKTSPQSKKTSIGYFSLHDINSYPCEYGDEAKVQAASLCLENAHNQTIWNVHLQPWKTEADFWALYESRYLVLLDKARQYLRSQTQRLRATSPSVQPKSAIFISAGFDASEHEGEGMQRHKVNVPTEFYARFTHDILRIADEEGTGAHGRVISVLEGGYSNRALMSGVLSHVSGMASRSKAGVETSHEINMSLNNDDARYDKTWWHIDQLQELEGLLQPALLQQPKKPRTSDLSTFASPTQSFSAKVVDPSKVYRSLSGAVTTAEPTRLPTPPPPEVDWATAAHELSRLLIPDRQVNSCTYEDLNDPQPKRQRHSTIGLPTEKAGEKMETRGRKAKVPSYPLPNGVDGAALPIRKASSSNRRQTISELPMTNDNKQGPERPTTSDSQAGSEGSTVHAATTERSSRTTSPSKFAKDAAKVHRTRRASGAMTDLLPKDPNIKAPPVPKMPTKFGQPTQSKPPVPRFKREGTTDTTGSSDMDGLTNGVKKITLKMPKKEEGEPGSMSPKSATTKAPRKPAVSRTNSAKTGVTKAGPSRTSKALPIAAAPGDPVQMLQAQAIEATHQRLDSNPAAGSTNESTIASQTPSYPMPTASNARGSSEFTTATLPGAAEPVPSIESSEIQAMVSEPLAPATVEALKPSVDLIAQEPTPPPEPFIPYNPSTDFPSAASTHQHTTQPDALTWLPPNTNTPAQTPVKRKATLPAFSATGAIPFAARQTAGNLKPAPKGKQDGSKQLGQNIYDVPDTPKR